MPTAENPNEPRCKVTAAIDSLRRIPAEVAPGVKLHRIVQGCKCLLALETSKGDPIGADGLVPLLLYATVQAAVPNLLSEMRYMEYLVADPHQLASGESGYFFVTMTAVLEYLLTVGQGQYEMGVTAVE